MCAYVFYGGQVSFGAPPSALVCTVFFHPFFFFSLFPLSYSIVVSRMARFAVLSVGVPLGAAGSAFSGEAGRRGSSPEQEHRWETGRSGTVGQGRVASARRSAEKSSGASARTRRRKDENGRANKWEKRERFPTRVMPGYRCTALRALHTPRALTQVSSAGRHRAVGSERACLPLILFTGSSRDGLVRVRWEDLVQPAFRGLRCVCRMGNTIGRRSQRNRLCVAELLTFDRQ